MNPIWFYLIALLIGFIIGYIVKDLLTIEKKVVVNVKKQKIKGEGNQIDTDFDIEIKEAKKERFKLFKRKNK